MPRLTNLVLAKHKSKFGYRPDPKRYKIWFPPFIVQNVMKTNPARTTHERPCTDEMKTMLDCFKIHDFQHDDYCRTQINQFYSCIKKFKESTDASAPKHKADLKKMDIDRLLRKIPHPPIDLKLKR